MEVELRATYVLVVYRGFLTYFTQTDIYLNMATGIASFLMFEFSLCHCFADIFKLHILTDIFQREQITLLSFENKFGFCYKSFMFLISVLNQL